MHAVFSTGGKQYRVTEGDVLRVEKLLLGEGDSVDFDQVLMVSDGDGGKVTATVKSHGRGDKVQIVKFKRRKHHLKSMGHRQAYTELEITGIAAD